MKKTVLFLFLLLAVIAKSRAQNVFAPQGAEWWYDGDTYDCATPMFDQPIRQKWTDHLKVIGDTTINGNICSVLEANRMMKDAAGQIYINETKHFYTFDNTDTVFIYNDSITNFSPLYIFNVEVNDTIKYGQPTHLFSYVIDSIRYTHVNNDSLKTVYSHTFSLTPVPYYSPYNWGCYGYGSMGNKSGSYTEKIGMHDGVIYGLFPIEAYLLADGLAFGTFPMGRLRCYNDGAISLKNGNLPCDTVMPLAIRDISKSNLQLTISPNPASTQINIQSKLAFENNSWLAATDVLGRVMMQPIQLDKKKDVSLDVSNWANGIYLIRIQLGNQAYYQKISVQH